MARMPIELQVEEQLLNRIIDYLKAMFGDYLLAIALIGSRANGYASAKSDVDLHIILTDNANENHLGLRRQMILGAEVHFLAVTESTLRKAASDVRRQPMENVCLTLFRYEPIFGSPHFRNAAAEARTAEFSATRQWLKKSGQVVPLEAQAMAMATIIRKLTWAPPLVERWERKAKEIGLEKTWADAAENITVDPDSLNGRCEDEHGDRGPMGAQRIALANLIALSSRHRNLSRDVKSAVNGAIFGPFFLSLAIYEATSVQRAGLNTAAYVGMRAPDGIAAWLADSARIPGVRWARAMRNRIKDRIV